MIPDDGLGAEIRAHYEEDFREEERLRRGEGLLEFLRTQEILHRHLPSPPAVVVDVGGGTGAYALPLAKEGFEVHLLDPVERHVERARELSAQQTPGLAAADIGDARTLPHATESADAVLLLGPLYHLTKRTDRLTALREARRVLKPGGHLFAAAVCRFASLAYGLLFGMLHDAAFEKIVDRDLEEGQHRNPDRRPEWFTTAYFHRPEELALEVAEAGFHDVEVLPVEGMGWLDRDLDEDLRDDERRDRLMALMRRLEHEETLIGASAHLLAYARS